MADLPKYQYPSTSEVWYLQNVPLDNTYTNTIVFYSRLQQRQWFKSKVKLHDNGSPYHYTDMTQIRLKGVIRTPNNIANLQNVNYLMFWNPNFDSMDIDRQVWYYAFVTDIKYINPNCTEVSFEIDAFQTWFMDCEFKSCFVERETPDIDMLHRNTIPEGLEFGELVRSNTIKWRFDDMRIFMATTIDLSEFNPANGSLIQGIYHGVRYYSWQLNSAEINLLNGTIKQLAGRSEAIVSMFMCPMGVYTNNQRTIPFVVPYTTIDGYTPKNLKLFSYPYFFVEITNNLGDVVPLPLHLFYLGRDTIEFQVQNGFSTTPSAMLVPQHFDGQEDAYDYAVVYNKFPQCTWNIDSFKDWISQHSLSIGLTFAKDILVAGGAVAATVATGGAALPLAMAGGAIMNSATSAANTAAQIAEKSLTPPAVRGSSQGDVFNIANNRCGFDIRLTHITAEYARCIDDYFTRFGYATNQVKVPTTTTTRGYKYLKTQNCNLVYKNLRGAPVEYLTTMRKAIDNGITFWASGDKVGDYS